MTTALRDRAAKIYLDSLEQEGKRILEECVNERDYEHRTRNLYDSYGYGVYMDGSLKRIGFLSASATATKPKKWYGEEIRGREEITDFLNQHKTGGKFALSIVAAMPYAAVLEAGGGGVKRKYKVISMSYDKLKAIAPKFSGSVDIIRE